MIGVIGGSGLYSGINGLKGTERWINTPYGRVKMRIGENFAFLSRHGNPPVPPHMINHHANIMAFHMLEIKNIIAVSSVGSLRKDIPPGTLILPENLLDFTHRVWTYHNEKPYHVNMYEPFCKELREKIHRVAGIPTGGTYATMKGPQFETAAEANMLRILGADVVGMTVAPEAKLAKEIGLCYQPVCIVVNYVDRNTSHEGTLNMMEKMMLQVEDLACRMIENEESSI